MRTRNSVLTFGTSVAFTGVTMLVGFVATPLLLRWLGVERFGAFRAASDWLGWMVLADLGVGGALRARLAVASGPGDEAGFGRTLHAGFWLYLRVACLTAAFGGAILLFLPYLIPVTPALAGDLRVGVLIAVVTGSVFTVLSPLRAAAETRQRGYWVNLVLLGQSLVVTGASVALAAWGAGVTGQFVAVAAGATLLNLALALDGARAHPGLLRSSLAPVDPEARRALTALNTPTLLMNLCGRLGLLSDNLVVAAVLGPAAVVPFVLTQRLTGLAQGQLQSVGSATWAALADLHFRGERARFNQRLVQLTGWIAVAGVALLAPIVVLNPFFVGRWVGSGQYAGFTLTLLAAVNAALLSLVSLWGWCFSATAKIQVLVRPSLAQLAINVAGSVALTRAWGLAGPLAGTLAGLVCVSLWYIPLQLRREFGTSLRALAGAVALPMALGVPYAALLGWVTWRVHPTRWIEIGVLMAVGSLGFGVVWLLALAAPREREFVLRRVSGWFAR